MTALPHSRSEMSFEVEQGHVYRVTWAGNRMLGRTLVGPHRTLAVTLAKDWAFVNEESTVAYRVEASERSLATGEPTPAHLPANVHVGLWVAGGRTPLDEWQIAANGNGSAESVLQGGSLVPFSALRGQRILVAATAPGYASLPAPLLLL